MVQVIKVDFVLYLTYCTPDRMFYFTYPNLSYYVYNHYHWGNCRPGGRAGFPLTEKLVVQILPHPHLVFLGKTLNPHCLV